VLAERGEDASRRARGERGTLGKVTEALRLVALGQGAHQGNSPIYDLDATRVGGLCFLLSLGSGASGHRVKAGAFPNAFHIMECMFT
jgi:hypothetical protein